MQIDAVIPWVDGTDTSHVKKRASYLESRAEGFSSEVIANRRWSNAGELRICLMSIGIYAPWIRRIWIVTDNQHPDLKGLPQDLVDKVAIVDHSHIFRGFEEFLPIFNSLSIGTASWRIEGLADRYIYFNDDTFFFRPVRPSDFFRGDKVVLRGHWKHLRPEGLGKFLNKIYRHNKIEGAKRLGFDEDRFFSLAHVAHPLRRDVLAATFEAHPDWLHDNLEPRFRCEGQFSITSLFAHLMLLQGRGVIKRFPDWRNFSSEWCRQTSLAQAKAEMRLHRLIRTKLICVNDLEKLEGNCPGFTDVLTDYFKAGEARAAM